MLGSVHIERKRIEATEALESTNLELDRRIKQRSWPGASAVRSLS